MYINRKGITCHIAKIDKPRIWYPINLLIPSFSEEYIAEKLGITDPEKTKSLQDEFLQSLESVPTNSWDYLESRSVRHDKHDWMFYLADKNKSSATLFIELLISPEAYHGSERCPRGFVWTQVTKKDTPETLAEKLYTTNMRFAKALYRKLWKIMGW
jgi:hypothetical protein